MEQPPLAHQLVALDANRLGLVGRQCRHLGLAGLATGVAITSLANAAAAPQKTVIVVPGGSYLLQYGSVKAGGSHGVSFSCNLGAGEMLNGAANCQAGFLNGQLPGSACQARLLNAVCQGAYGAGG